MLSGEPAVLQAPVFDDLVMDICWDAVPYPARCRWPTLQRFGAALEVEKVRCGTPSCSSASRAGTWDCSTILMISSFSGVGWAQSTGARHARAYGDCYVIAGAKLAFKTANQFRI